MDFQVLLTFVRDDDEEQLFSAAAGYVPRVGDTVTYSMEATDRAEWSDDAWVAKQAVSGREWTVVSVHHEFRRLSVLTPEIQVMFVYVKPNVRANRPARGPQETR